jgi:hypothetical protein
MSPPTGSEAQILESHADSNLKKYPIKTDIYRRSVGAVLFRADQSGRKIRLESCFIRIEVRYAELHEAHHGMSCRRIGNVATALKRN